MVGIIYITGKDRAVYREAVNLLGSQCLSQCRVAVKLLELRIYVETFFLYIGLEAVLGGGGLCNTDDLAIQVFKGLDSGQVLPEGQLRPCNTGWRNCRFLFFHR